MHVSGILCIFVPVGHQEKVTSGVVVTCTGKGVSINGNQITGVTGKRSLVTVSYNDFTGKTVSTSFYVNRSQPIVGDVNGDDVLDENDLKAVITLWINLKRGTLM